MKTVLFLLSLTLGPLLSLGGLVHFRLGNLNEPFQQIVRLADAGRPFVFHLLNSHETTVVNRTQTAAVSGVRVQSKWNWRIVDLFKLPRAYMKVDEGAIGKVVRALKGKTDIPGVEVSEDKQIAASPP